MLASPVVGNPPSDHHEPEPQDTSADAPDPGQPAAGALEAEATADDAPDLAEGASRAVAAAAVEGEQLDPAPLDLGKVAADLDGVEAALQRLDEGTYWTDEVTGEPIADEVLAADPITRRAGSQ